MPNGDVRRGGRGPDTRRLLYLTLRLIAAVPLLVAAAWFARRGWSVAQALGDVDQDNPDGVYLTTAALGFCLAALLAAVGLVIAWGSLRRRGGLLVVAALAVAVSLLPHLLYKWADESVTWPWVFFMEQWSEWLRLTPRSREVGLLIQAALATVAVGSVAAHIWIAWPRPGAPRLARPS